MALEAQNNPFTSVLFVGAADPEALPDADPSAGSYRFVIDDTGAAWIVDSTGTATAVSAAAGAVGTDSIWDAAGDLAIGTGANTASKLTKGANGLALVSGASTVSWVDILPWHIFVIPMMATPDATTGTWVTTGGDNDSGFGYLFYTPGSTANSGSSNRMFNSSAAQNDAWAIDLVLGAGTWDCHIWGNKNTNAPIVTLNQDGSSAGTGDFYAAAKAAAKVSITGWTVATSAKHRMELKFATKNASSSGYTLGLQGIEFRRTA